MTINTKTGFDNIGMGISAVGGWVNGEWVSLSAISEGKGQRRTWHVIGDFRRNNAPVRVEITKVNCFRYEAADEAIAALVELMGERAAPVAMHA